MYSKKNSKRMFFKGKRRLILSSKAYIRSVNDFLSQLQETVNIDIWNSMIEQYYKIEDNKNYPLRIHLKFYRRTKRKFDNDNIGGGFQDILVKSGLIKDDTSMDLNVFFGDHEVDKDTPRCQVSFILEKPLFKLI